jgi:cytochrome c
MSAHPQLSIEESQKIISYILSLNSDEKSKEKEMPINGTIEFKEQSGEINPGIYVLMVSYLDKGSKNQPDAKLSTRKQVVFNPTKLEAENAIEKSAGLTNWGANDATLVGSIVHDSYIKFNEINFKNLKSIKFSAYYGADYSYKGTLEIREGSPNGPIIGKTQMSYYNKEKGIIKYYDIPVHSTKNKEHLFLVFKNESNKKQYVANANWIILNYK